MSDEVEELRREVRALRAELADLRVAHWLLSPFSADDSDSSPALALGGLARHLARSAEASGR